MKKSDTNEQVLSRRKALGRIGLFATAAYTVPAFATLSMAHASSGASSTSSASVSTSGASVSGPSVSGPSISVPSSVEALCSEGELATVAGDLTNPQYVQCLVDNGVDLGVDFVLPEGVILPI